MKIFADFGVPGVYCNSSTIFGNVDMPDSKIVLNTARFINDLITEYYKRDNDNSFLS